MTDKMTLNNNFYYLKFLLIFVIGMLCGSLPQLMGKVSTSEAKEGITSGQVRGLQECAPSAFSTLSGQGVHSFMSAEFKKATSLDSDKVIKHHYELMYAPFLSRFYHTSFRMMEIGVEKGNSIQSWSRLFPHVKHVYGVGYGYGVVNTDLKRSLDEKTTLYYADQSNITQLEYLVQDIGRESLDVIIDDGSHIPWHQVVTFDILFKDLLAPGGTYIIEDIETSYWSSRRAELYHYKIPNAGVGQGGSVVERFKSIVDVVNRKFFASPEFSVIGNNKVDHLVASISFSRNCIIIEKMNHIDGWTKQNLKTKNYMNSGYVNRPATKEFTTQKSKPISGLPQYYL